MRSSDLSYASYHTNDDASMGSNNDSLVANFPRRHVMILFPRYATKHVQLPSEPSEPSNEGDGDHNETSCDLVDVSPRWLTYGVITCTIAFIFSVVFLGVLTFSKKDKILNLFASNEIWKQHQTDSPSSFKFSEQIFVMNTEKTTKPSPYIYSSEHLISSQSPSLDHIIPTKSSVETPSNIYLSSLPTWDNATSSSNDNFSENNYSNEVISSSFYLPEYLLLEENSSFILNSLSPSVSYEPLMTSSSPGSKINRNLSFSPSLQLTKLFSTGVDSPTIPLLSGKTSIPTSPNPILSASFPTRLPTELPSMNPSQYPTKTDIVIPSLSPEMFSISPTLGPSIFKTTSFLVAGHKYQWSLFVRKFENITENDSLIRNEGFLVFLGDFNNIYDGCNETSYSNFRHVMLERISLPAFAVPGGNDWNNCPDPDEAIYFWRSYLGNMEASWSKRNGIETVSRQKGYEENFSFPLRSVLYIGLNMAGGHVTDVQLWDERIKSNIDWVKAQLMLHNDCGALVVFGNDDSYFKYNVFFEELATLVDSFSIPSVYIHETSKHSLAHKVPSTVTPFYFLRVQGGLWNKPFVTVTVDLSKEMPFIFNL